MYSLINEFHNFKSFQHKYNPIAQKSTHFTALLLLYLHSSTFIFPFQHLADTLKLLEQLTEVLCWKMSSCLFSIDQTIINVMLHICISCHHLYFMRCFKSHPVFHLLFCVVYCRVALTQRYTVQISLMLMNLVRVRVNAAFMLPQ